MFEIGMDLYKEYLRLEKIIETDKSLVSGIEFEAARLDGLNFKYGNKCLAEEIEMGG